MTTGTLKTQGTELFVVDSVVASDPYVMKIACPTGISGLGGAADQLDDTCLDSTERTFKRGLGNPGTLSVPFNFIPSHASHQALMQMKADGTVMRWMIGLSDGVAVPTLDSDLGFVEPPAPQRTTAEFDAYISDITIDIAGNEIVRGTLTLQRSGEVQWNWNGPVPT